MTCKSTRPDVAAKYERREPLRVGALEMVEGEDGYVRVDLSNWRWMSLNAENQRRLAEWLDPTAALDLAQARRDLEAAGERIRTLEADNARLAQERREIAEALRLERMSADPEWDATDAAHPAWWRGHANGSAGMVRSALHGRLVVGTDTDGKRWMLSLSSAAEGPIYWLTLLGQVASHHHVTGTPLDACLCLDRDAAEVMWFALGEAFGFGEESLNEEGADAPADGPRYGPCVCGDSSCPSRSPAADDLEPSVGDEVTP